MLILKVDGGPDRNPNHVAAKLAYIALSALCPRLEMMVVQRNAANQSYTNPVERTMSVINLALQGVALAREPADAPTEKVLKDCKCVKQPMLQQSHRLLALVMCLK